MSEWFYVQNGQQAGPVETGRLAHLLASGQVKRDDLVWRDGMVNWVELRTVPELTPPAAAPTNAPPATFTAAPPQAIAAPIPVAAYYSNQPREFDSLPQSRLGLASFAIGIIALVIEIAGMAGAAMGATTTATPSPSPTSSNVQLSVSVSKSAPGAATMVAGFALIGGALLCLIGAGLGVASLYQKRRRIFGVIGLVINGGILLLFVVLMVIGLLAK